MDDEEFTAATDRWVEHDLIEREQAEAILAYERDREPSGRADSDRVTSIIAIVGALLMGVGIIIGLAASWDAMNDATRTVILIAAPIVMASAGLTLQRRGISRAGVGLWILSTILWGPILFILAEIHAPTVEAQWIFLGWGILALPMGHTFRTRLGTAVGIATLLIALGLSTPETTGIYTAALVGTVLIAATTPISERIPAFLETYRLLGTAPVIGTLLWLAIVGSGMEVETGPVLGATFLISFAAVGVSWWWVRQNRAEPATAVLTVIPLVGAVLGLIIVLIEGHIPSLIGLLLIQGVLLVTLLAIAAVAVTLDSRWLINLVALGFFLQVITLLVTLTDELPGAVALIVAGAVLVGVSIALERGRRRLIARLPGSE